MTPELERLLSRKPTQDEWSESIHEVQNETAHESWRNSTDKENMVNCTANEKAGARRATVLATLKEAAKLVCGRCAKDMKVSHYLPGTGLNDSGHPRETWGEDIPTWVHYTDGDVHYTDGDVHFPDCDAQEIMQAIAASEADKRCCDNEQRFSDD